MDFHLVGNFNSMFAQRRYVESLPQSEQEPSFNNIGQVPSVLF